MLIRLRLVCAGPTEPAACAACQSSLLDSGAAHATCCAVGEATRARYAVAALIHAAAQSCVHTAEMEIPGTDLRPADVLSSALGNAYTALDISICSPHAQQAGPDCTRSRLAAKLEPHLPSLLHQNISCTPPMNAPTKTRWPVDRFALSQQIHRALLALLDPDLWAAAWPLPPLSAPVLPLRVSWFASLGPCRRVVSPRTCVPARSSP